MQDQNQRVVSTSAVALITEALREIVPDVGLKVRRTFAFDQHGMTPLEFVQSLGMLNTSGGTPFNTHSVNFMLVPMTAVFTPMSPGECSALNVLERRLGFLETIVRYTHHFYREVMAKELETAGQGRIEESAAQLVKRISQLCLQLLDEEAMQETLLGNWLESQHDATASTRQIHQLTNERLVWTTGLDRYVLSETGLAWERNGRPWFDSIHIDGIEHKLSYKPVSKMYEMLAADDSPKRPNITLVQS